MNKKRINILFIGMAVISIAILIGTGVYAYYRSTISGTTSGTIARWSFKANNQAESFNINLGKAYPGKTGTYNLELSAEDSDLDVYYELYFTKVGIPFEQSSRRIVSHLYFDNGYTKKILACEYSGKYGIIPAGEKITIPLFYNWEYDEGWPSTEDVADGTLSELYEFKIVAQQYTAYDGTIPIKILEDNFWHHYEDGYIRQTCPS